MEAKASISCLVEYWILESGDNGALVLLFDEGLDLVGVEDLLEDFSFFRVLFTGADGDNRG